MSDDASTDDPQDDDPQDDEFRADADQTGDDWPAGTDTGPSGQASSGSESDLEPSDLELSDPDPVAPDAAEQDDNVPGDEIPGQATTDVPSADEPSADRQAAAPIGDDEIRSRSSHPDDQDARDGTTAGDGTTPGGPQQSAAHSDRPLPPPGLPPGIPMEPTRRMYRDPRGPIAGVATGVARFFGIDPLLVQVLFVLFAFAGGVGIGVYIALWLVLPTVGPNGTLVRPAQWQTIVGATILALMLFFGALAIGIPFAGKMAIVLIVIGVLLLTQRPGAVADLSAQARDTFAPRPAHYSPDFVPPSEVLRQQGQPAYSYQRPVPPTARAGYPTSADQSVPPSVGTTPASVGQPGVQTPYTQVPNNGGPYAWATPRTEPAGYTPARRPTAPAGPPITALTFAIAVLATGVMLVLKAVLPISSAAAWGAFALVCGGGLVASAFRGRGAWLLLLPASIALIGMGASISVSEWGLRNYDWSVGEVNVKVSTAGDLNDEYSIGVGAMKLDLTDLALSEDESFDISVGVGEATVLVPEGMNVALSGDVGQGEVTWFGESISSVNGTLKRQRITGGDAAPTLTIIADVGLGELTVKNG